MKRTTLLSVLLTLALVFSLFTCLTLGTSAADKAPIALYLFEDENNIGKDDSGNGNDLVINKIDENSDGVSWEDGKAVFTNEGALSTPENADFTDTLTEVTFAIKFKTTLDGKGTRTLISTGWSYHPAGFAVAFQGDKMVTAAWNCIKRNDGDFNMNQVFMFDEWHTLVFTISVNDNKLVAYLDGVETANGTAAGYVANHPDVAFTIGGFARTLECFTGEVEEVAVFDYALTAAEVASLDMASLKPAPAPENPTPENPTDPAPETGSALVAVAMLSAVAGGVVLSLKRRK